MWLTRVISLKKINWSAILITLLVTSCAYASSPETAASESSFQPPPNQPKMSSELTHLPVQLSLPYYPWANYYQSVRTNPILAPYLDQQMIPALEATGDPVERLTKMAQAAQAARIDLGKSGQQADFTFQGLDPVETDLRVAFFVALANAIANSSQAPVEAKLIALKELLTLVKAESPVGIPEPSAFASWNATARITAETEIMVRIEDLVEDLENP